jgi:hypothetical protein
MATKKILLKVAPATGDPIKKVGDTVIPAGRGKTDQEFDIRDRLAELVGKGNVLSPDDKAAIFGNLTSSLGKEKAMKLMNHAFIFNQRPDIVNLPVEEKLKAFYTIGSNDRDVNDLITKSKSLGYGAIPGFRQSASAVNQQLSGQIPVTATANGVSPAEIQKRVMLQVRK